MSDPFREQRIAPAEVRRILRRAAELAEADPETSAVEKPLTRVEIERSAEELGIPATAIARALESDLETAQSTQKKGFLGAPTRIVVEERLARQSIGLFVGLGVGGGVGPMGAYIALIANFGLVALPIPFLWIALMLVLARTIYVGMHKKRDRELRRLFDRVIKHSAGWSHPPVRARVEAPAQAEEIEEDVSDEQSARRTT